MNVWETYDISVNEYFFINLLVSVVILVVMDRWCRHCVEQYMLLCTFVVFTNDSVCFMCYISTSV